MNPDYFTEGLRLMDLLRETMGMMSFDRSVRLCTLLMDCADVPGDVVEFGCNEGKTSVLLSAIMPKTKRLWVYDSFRGLPTHQEQVAPEYVPGSMRASADALRERLVRHGEPLPVVTQGWFSDINEKDLPERISFALLDGDLYRSIRDSLRLVWPRMSPGGIVAIDDCEHPGLPGPAKAVVDFFLELNVHIYINKPNGVGEKSMVWWVRK